MGSNEPCDAIENVDFCRFLVAGYGLEDLYDELFSLKIVKRYIGSVEDLQLVQNRMCPPYKDMDLARRVEIALSKIPLLLRPSQIEIVSRQHIAGTKCFRAL